MQPGSVSKTPEALHPNGNKASGTVKQRSTKEILQRLKSQTKTNWRFISHLLEVNVVNLPLQTEGIVAYGRSQRWQHALALFQDLRDPSIGFRLDAVVVSAAVSSLERGLRWAFTLEVLRRGAASFACPATPRGLTSSAAACGQQSEWTWSLRLHASGTPSVQSLTVTVTACEKASRWSCALELCRQSINGRLQVDFMAMNSILNACAGARQWQSCLEVADRSTNKEDAVMSNILSNACSGPERAWTNGMAVLRDATHRTGTRGLNSLLAGFSAVMQSLSWLTAVDVLKDLRRGDVELDAMSFSSFLKTLELDGNWQYSLRSLKENDQKQLAPDGLLYNALVSSSEKSSDWKAALSLFTLRMRDLGLDTTSISATVLSCCQSKQWATALELLRSSQSDDSTPSTPPTSHALAALISAVEDIPEVEVGVLLMLANATVDGVAPPAHLLGMLQSALLAAATYRHPFVGTPCFTPPGLSATGSQEGLYRYSKELQLLRHVITTVARGSCSSRARRVCEAIEGFGATNAASRSRWLKVAGTQKAKVLEAVVAGVERVELDTQKPTKILEIGTYCGYSALRMFLHVTDPTDSATADPTALEIHSLEADPIHAAVACNVFQLAGINQKSIQIHMGHSKTLLPKWPSGGTSTSFRAVFMDQRGSRYEEDLRVMEDGGLLAKGAAVIADNVLKPGAPRFLWKLQRPYHVQILSLQEFAMPSEDWMTVSIRGYQRRNSSDSECSQPVPEKIQELHYLAEAMRDLASKPGGASVSFGEWKNFALKMKEELKMLGIQATAQLKMMK